MVWRPVTKYGVAVKDYTPRTRHCLSLAFGEAVQILEETDTDDENVRWYRGHTLKKGAKWGVFPANHVHLKPSRLDGKNLIEPIEDPVAREVTDVLREWGTIMKELFRERKEQQYKKIRKVMDELIDARRRIVGGTLPEDHLQELKGKITGTIDWGNHELGLDLIPRNLKGEAIDAESGSVIELYRIHQKSVETGKRSTSFSIRRSHAKKSHVKMHHLFFKNILCACHVEEEKEVYFSLYDAEDHVYISEAYLVRLPHGLPYDANNLEGMSCVFTELSLSKSGSNGHETIRDIYLVCHIVRRGPMEYQGKPSNSRRPMFRRPVACAVKSLRECIENLEKQEASLDAADKEPEFAMQLYKPNDEHDFHMLHEALIQKSTTKYQSLDRAKGVIVQLQLLEGDMVQVKKEHPLKFQKGMPLARKRGFPEVIMPGDVRNDLYVTLCWGQFDKGDKRAPRNIEVTVMVCLDDGQKLPNCIVVGAGEKPVTEYTSVVYYHSNNPKWYETLKLEIPIEKFESAHLKFYFKHCSSKENMDKQTPFCFSYMPLMQDAGITLKDGEHIVRVAKYNSHHDATNSAPPYLTNPACLKINENAKLVIQTLVCSTKLTQNTHLLNLLKWRALPNELEETLGHLTYVEGEEIVKFLTDIFDQVFSILDLRPDCAKLVFDALARIIGLLADKKFHNFAPVLDAYIHKHFSGAMAHKRLVSTLKEYVQQAADTNVGSQFRNAIKALEYIFKFIIQSRMLYKRAKPINSGDAEFKEELDQLFTSFNQMMRLKEPPTILANQNTTLQHFASIFTDLNKIYSMKELSEIATNFMNSILDTPEQAKLTQHKLPFMLTLVQGPLFASAESRKVLLPSLLEITARHIERNDHMDKALDILAEVLHRLQALDEDVYLDVLEVVKASLRPVIAVGLNMTREDPCLGKLLVSLLAMLHLMNEAKGSSDGTSGSRDMYKDYTLHLETDKELRNFLQSIFDVFTNLVQTHAFRQDWIVLTMLQNDVILNTVQFVSSALTESFLRGSSFDMNLWQSFFHLSVSYLCQPSLQVEEFSGAKRDKILAKHGDKRELMAVEVGEMWKELRDHQVHFIPALVGDFQKMALIPSTNLRKVTIPIFFDMLEREVESKGNFKQVELEIIDKLDIYVTQGSGDMEYKELLTSIWTERCEASKLPCIKENGPAFIESVKKLLTRLLHLRNVPAGDEHRDERANCVHNLLLFYKENERREMYIRYIHKLRDIHESSQHFTEAAFTLKLHADLLKWTDTPLEAYSDAGQGKSVRYPAQMERERKATIFREVINLFDKGQTWEHAIDLCKELATEFELQLFDYPGLSGILKQQAQFFDNICKQQRDEPQYFYTGYYGQGFPPGVRNQSFVYRGWKKNHITVFTDRIQSQFPGATILMKNIPPTKEMMEGSDMNIMICKVSPIVDPSIVRFNGRDVPDAVKAYYQSNDLLNFFYVRPFRKGAKTDNEFENLWTERVTLTCANNLPGLLNRALIVGRESQECSPIVNAIESMVNKNEELKTIIGVHAKKPGLNVNPLTMALNGVIDAAVMGGVDMYRKAFFTDEFANKDPGNPAKIEQLKHLIEIQMEILEGGLLVHGKNCPPNLAPMQEKLEMQLRDMKKKHGGDSSPRRETLQRSTSSKETGTPAAAPGGGGDRSSVASLPAHLKRNSGLSQSVRQLNQQEKNDDLKRSQSVMLRKSASPSTNPSPDKPSKPVAPTRGSSFVSKIGNPFKSNSDKKAEKEKEKERSDSRSQSQNQSAATSPAVPRKPQAAAKPAATTPKPAATTPKPVATAGAAAAVAAAPATSSAPGTPGAGPPPPRPNTATKPKVPKVANPFATSGAAQPATPDNNTTTTKPDANLPGASSGSSTDSNPFSNVTQVTANLPTGEPPARPKGPPPKPNRASKPPPPRRSSTTQVQAPSAAEPNMPPRPPRASIGSDPNKPPPVTAPKPAALVEEVMPPRPPRSSISGASNPFDSGVIKPPAGGPPPRPASKKPKPPPVSNPFPADTPGSDLPPRPPKPT